MARVSSRAVRVCYPFIGNNVGGSHISTLMLIERVRAAGVEPVIVLHEEGKLRPYLEQLGLPYKLVRIPRYFEPPYWSRRNTANLAWQTWRLAAFLRRERIDVVHTNDVRIHFGWTLATRLAGAKLVWHQRTGTFGRSRAKLAMAQLAHRVVCISHYTATTLPQELRPLIQVVANPFDVRLANIDRAARRRAILTELGLTGDTRVLGFFGNLVEQKRPEMFLRAAAEIARQSETAIAFLLFGADRGTARADLCTLAAELEIADLVHFMGFRAPIEPWMAGCDLMIAPAVGEGLGRSLVEATIVGTPVVAANSGGHREVIRDGEDGLLAAPDDPSSFAAAACRILDNPGLASNLAARARDRSLHSYSTEDHVGAMTEIYLKCLGKRSHKGHHEQRARADLR